MLCWDASKHFKHRCVSTLIGQCNLDTGLALGGSEIMKCEGGSDSVPNKGCKSSTVRISCINYYHHHLDPRYLYLVHELIDFNYLGN